MLPAKTTILAPKNNFVARDPDSDPAISDLIGTAGWAGSFYYSLFFRGTFWHNFLTYIRESTLFLQMITNCIE